MKGEIHYERLHVAANLHNPPPTPTTKKSLPKYENTYLHCIVKNLYKLCLKGPINLKML